MSAPSAILLAIVLVLLGAATAVERIPGAAAAGRPVGSLPVGGAPPTTDVDAEAPPPRRLVVERLGIDTGLERLRVQPDGALSVPVDYDVAGWHRGGTVPGDTGPAVLVGHVDSYRGPAVFYRLRELQPGDQLTVERIDGSTLAFEVYGVETVAKDAFPTQRVYGATAGPELRLLTCGGAFDPKAKSYEDNVVVYARVVVPAAPA